MTTLLAIMAACQQTPEPIKTTETHSVSDIRSDILAVLETQQQAWNRGDIPAFMQGYWRSDQLRFASGGTVTRGWETVNKRYQSRYDAPEKMGQLQFADLEVELLASGQEAVVYGRWTLLRDSDKPTGLFMLLLRQMNGQWKIISDTTTSAD